MDLDWCKYAAMRIGGVGGVCWCAMWSVNGKIAEIKLKLRHHNKILVLVIADSWLGSHTLYAIAPSSFLTKTHSQSPILRCFFVYLPIARLGRFIKLAIAAGDDEWKSIMEVSHLWCGNRPSGIQGNSVLMLEIESRVSNFWEKEIDNDKR